MALLAVAVVLNLSHFSLATPVVARDIYASRTVPHRSCETLINHCVDTSTPSEIKQTWSIHSCVAAAACYGAEAVVDILCTRTTVCPRLRDEVRIPSDMYTSIVPACAAIGPGCYMSQDSYREFHYATLHSINAGEIPTGAEVDAIWDSLAFSATSCGFNCQNPRLSYKEFNQWFQIPEPVGVLTPAEPPGKRSTPTTTHVRPKSSSKTSITLNTASESMKSFKEHH
ncbi:hypothetical protein DFH09DRAFT_199203 [Mycena vulgaris]|nr:hypothetical protein DFH09DRAFT_199203 [Mycena vulgaris]